MAAKSKSGLVAKSNGKEVIKALSKMALKKAAEKAKRAESKAKKKDAKAASGNNGKTNKTQKMDTAQEIAAKELAASKVKVKRSQLEKAVKAVLQLAQKRSSGTNPLFAGSSETMQVMFTLSRVPDKRQQKPVLIPLPHPLFDESSEVCFISKDPQKEYKDVLIRQKPVPGLTKVLGLDKLRRNYKTAEQKRALADSFDLFLCDARIIEMMPSLLGSVFYEKKKKRPVPIKLSMADPAPAIKKAMGGTALRVPSGPSFGVRIGRCSMSETDLVENAAVVIAQVVRHLHQNPIQTIHVQATETQALPIWKRVAPPGERLNLKKYHSDQSSAASQSGDASATVSDTEAGSFLPSDAGGESLSELETEGESVSMLETAGESLSELDSDAGDGDEPRRGAKPLLDGLKKQGSKRSTKVSPKASPRASPRTSPKATIKTSPKHSPKSNAMMPPPKKGKKSKAKA
jgi:ribosome biogenesis protein UTP30